MPAVDGADATVVPPSTAVAEPGTSDAPGARSLMEEVLKARHEEGGKERKRDYHRMRHLITNAVDLYPDRMKELICLRFGTDDHRVIRNSGFAFTLTNHRHAVSTEMSGSRR